MTFLGTQMENVNMYRGVLNFLDGRVEIVLMPGERIKEGEILIPESINLGSRYFKLTKVLEGDVSFEYQEYAIHPDEGELCH